MCAKFTKKFARVWLRIFHYPARITLPELFTRGFRQHTCCTYHQYSLANWQLWSLLSTHSPVKISYTIDKFKRVKTQCGKCVCVTSGHSGRVVCLVYFVNKIMYS